jgi:Helix-turn-helix domain
MPNILDKITGSDEPFLTTREIAKKLKVSERAICDWARRYQDFPVIALPGAIRVRLSDLAIWLEQFQKATPAAKVILDRATESTEGEE